MCPSRPLGVHGFNPKPSLAAAQHGVIRLMQDKEFPPGLVRVSTVLWYVVSALLFALAAIDQLLAPLFSGIAVWFVVGFAVAASLIATVAPPWLRAVIFGVYR
jgi:hypothetical protein